MDVELKGSSPAALTAGILLLSRARSFGIPLRVSVVGDPSDIAAVKGPAILHSNVLASCGVGRELGQGPLVVVPGPADAPLLVCLAKEGQGPWFAVDGTGQGIHPATQAFVRLSRDPRPRARQAARGLRKLLAELQVPAEPALLDLAFGAPVPPLTRLALLVRAGRSLSGVAGTPITRYLAPSDDLPDPVGADGAAALALWKSGGLEPILARVGLAWHDPVHEFFEGLAALAESDEGRDLALFGALAELGSHLAMLPAQGMLPPPDSAADSVATGLGRALGASGGEPDANKVLGEIFRFLGGKFVSSARYPIALPDEAPPADRLERWRWFATNVAASAAHADELWRQVNDMPS